jgi:hypothetical protein
MCNSANHAISGEIFCKLSMYPRSENFYPTLVTSGDEDGAGAGLLADEGHDNHLVFIVGGLVLATGGGGDGILLQGSLQESVPKCILHPKERTWLISLYHIYPFAQIRSEIDSTT